MRVRMRARLLVQGRRLSPVGTIAHAARLWEPGCENRKSTERGLDPRGWKERAKLSATPGSPAVNPLKLEHWSR